MTDKTNLYSGLLMPKVLTYEVCPVSQQTKTLGLTIDVHKIETQTLDWNIKGFEKFVKSHLISYYLPPDQRKAGISDEEVFEKCEESIAALRKYCGRWKSKSKSKKTINQDPDIDDLILEEDHTPLKGLLGEWFLHSFCRVIFKTENLYSKVYLHQGKSPVKGFDIVHFKLDEQRSTYTLWLGEAKFYSNQAAGIDAALESLDKTTQYNYLQAQPGEDGENGEIAFIRRYAMTQNQQENSEAFKGLMYFLQNANRDDFVENIVLPVLLVLPESQTSNLKNKDKSFVHESLISFTQETVTKFQSRIKGKYHNLKAIDIRLMVLPLGNYHELVKHFERKIIND